MVLLSERSADDIYALSYLCQSDNQVCYEMCDYLITDGDVDEIMSDCRTVNHTMSESGEVDSVEIYKVVSISNASYAIVQKIKDHEIKLAQIYTQLDDCSAVEKMVDIASTIYDEEYEDVGSMHLVTKVRIR